jgi:hypothetical protein
MNQEGADASVIKVFQKALYVEMVTAQLQAAIDAHKARAADPEPLKKEMAKIEKEITNLVKACASGEVPDIATAIRERRARLEHLEGTVKGLGVTEKFDLQKFAEKLYPVVKDWHTALSKNASTAQQALRKLVPGRLVAQRNENGTWTFTASRIDFTPLIREVGVTGDAISAFLREVKVTRTRARRGARRGPRTA